MEQSSVMVRHYPNSDSTPMVDVCSAGRRSEHPRTRGRRLSSKLQAGGLTGFSALGYQPGNPKF